MSTLLKNKVAIVTGSAQGIGEATSEVLSREGALVMMCDINSRKLIDTVRNISQKTGNICNAHKVDVTNEAQVIKTVQEIVRKYKKVDILVNCAGIAAKLTPVTKINEEDWDRVFAVNVKGPLFFIKAVGKIMMRNKEGKIINLSSDAGKRAEFQEAIYCSSKSALIGLTRVVALELGPYNINCNAICPGAVDTPMLRKNYLTNPDKEKEFAESTALKRIAKPIDIANVILFLSSYLSDHITGEIILVTGGGLMGE